MNHSSVSSRHRSSLAAALVLSALLVPGTALAQCDPYFITDIGPMMVPPDTTVRTVSRECNESLPCGDYFEVPMLAGQTFIATMCSFGGTASFDATLQMFTPVGSNWHSGTCADNSCGQAPALVITAPADTTYLIAIGSVGGATGTYTLAYKFTDCGNGEIDPGETCDDGNGVDGDCCTASCEAEIHSCDDGLSCTVDDACSAAGICTGGPFDCSDPDLCTVDTCDETLGCQHALVPATGCLTSTKKAKIKISNSSVPEKDKLDWQWNAGPAVDQDDLGTPNVTDGTEYALCIYDYDQVAVNWNFEGRVEIAPSQTSWTSSDPKGLTYKDDAGLSDGVKSVQLKTGIETKSKAKLKASGINLTLPEPAGSTYFEQTLLSVQLHNSTGTCWGSTFIQSNTSANDPTSFKAWGR